jgi:hypothetical protein
MDDSTLGIALGVGFWILVIAGFVGLRGSRGMVISNLLLLDFQINANPSTVVYMRGRRRGITAWIMNLIGLGTDYKMHVTPQAVYIEYNSPLSGVTLVNLPIQMVNTVAAGYVRSLLVLILSGLIGTGGLIAVFTEDARIPGIICLVIGLILLLRYLMSRELEIRIATGEGFWGFRFSAGAMGLRVDFRQAVYDSVAAIHTAIQNAHYSAK